MGRCRVFFRPPCMWDYSFFRLSNPFWSTVKLIGVKSKSQCAGETHLRMAEKTVHSTYSLQRLSFSREKRRVLGHFLITENARSQELPGASPRGHPPGLWQWPTVIAYFPPFWQRSTLCISNPPILKSWLHACLWVLTFHETYDHWSVAVLTVTIHFIYPHLWFFLKIGCFRHWIQSVNPIFLLLYMIMDLPLRWLIYTWE